MSAPPSISGLGELYSLIHEAPLQSDQVCTAQCPCHSTRSSDPMGEQTKFPQTYEKWGSKARGDERSPVASENFEEVTSEGVFRNKKVPNGSRIF